MCPKSYNCSVTALTFQKYYNFYGKWLYLAYEITLTVSWLTLCKREHLPNPCHVHGRYSAFVALNKQKS